MVPRFFPRVEAKRLVDAVAVLASKKPDRVCLCYSGVFDWHVQVTVLKGGSSTSTTTIGRASLPFWQRRRLLRIARAATLKTKTGLIQ